MRTRIHWLLPDLASARAAMDDLLQAGVDLRRMHFVARDDFDLSGLHAAGVLQTTDVLRSAEAGLAVGAGVGGMLGAIAAVSYPDAGEPPLWNLIPVLVLAGALFDAWTSSMIGISAPNKQLQGFAAQIAQGRILLLVDVPAQRVRDIETRLQALCPQTRSQGTQPQVAAFP